MSQQFFWPGKYYYHPIGNTPAVCVTRDLPRDEPATMLLLGCGDVRNVLYTIFNEPQNARRQLDFTCCDYEPAVLARNIILFTMIVDGRALNTLWNTYFHMHLDKDSHSALIEQCKVLIDSSATMQMWRESSYGSFIRMSTEYSLSEIRRHWQLYANAASLSSNDIQSIRDGFKTIFEEVLDGSSSTSNTVKLSISPAFRSSGPSMMRPDMLEATLFKPNRFWKTGVTFSDPKLIQEATFINPTFVYSLGGDTCCVQYGTDPLTPFHLASVVGNARASISVDDIVIAAKVEFNRWCNSFKEALTSRTSPPPVIRFFLGDANSVCRSIHAFASSGTLNSGTPVSQWTTQVIQLDKDEYGSAPNSYNVIETSNLIDNFGLLNVMISSIPLLSTSTSSSVLYTESLLFKSEEPTKEFKQRLHADITTVSHLYGLCPVDYLAGFTSRSNTHEIIFQKAIKGYGNANFQFQQMTTWKVPSSGDTVAIANCAGAQPLKFQPYQLGTLLYDIYHSLFFQEDPLNFQRENKNNLPRAIAFSNLIQYNRETFVLLAKLVRDRHQIPEEEWDEIMDRFHSLHAADESMKNLTNNSHDLWTQFHRHGLYTVSFYRTTCTNVGRFKRWNSLPTLVRIILSVPREKLVVLQSSDGQASTPALQCEILGKSGLLHVFSAIHVAYGRVISTGTESKPQVKFEQDPQGGKGTMPLIVSFVMPSVVLTRYENQEDLKVCLALRVVPGATVLQLVSKLGPLLHLHSACLMDRDQVHVLPELPVRTISRYPATPPLLNPSIPNRGVLHQIGSTGSVIVELDDECELIHTLTSRIFILNDGVKRAFGSQGAIPKFRQASSCTMRISVGNHAQDVSFPFPVIGSLTRLRLARKSLYIEVVVPVHGPQKPDGMTLNPYTVIQDADGLPLNSWSFHRVNLARCPILDIGAKLLDKWFITHISSMLSSRESSRRGKPDCDVLTLIKYNIHHIFNRCAGTQLGPPMRLFMLADDNTKNVDTILFVNDIRYDLDSHTVICDAYVLPLRGSLLVSVDPQFQRLIREGNGVHLLVLGDAMAAWKQLLPALAERCRTWDHGVNCEFKAQRRIPLTQEMEEDADPLCSCGRGKDVSGQMQKDEIWKPFAPHVTRIALSPLFAVSYLESVGRNRDPALRRCYFCRARGKPRLKECTQCRKVRYCSEDCQKKDWSQHKKTCKA